MSPRSHCVEDDAAMVELIQEVLVESGSARSNRDAAGAAF